MTAVAEDVFARVRGVLCAFFHVPDTAIETGTRIAEDLGADSVDALDISGLVERQFKIRIPVERIPQMRTPQHIVDLVLSELDRRRAASSC